MSPRLLAAAAIVFGPIAAAAQPPTHRIECTDYQTIVASIGYEIRTTNFTVTRWLAACRSFSWRRCGRTTSQPAC